MLNRSKSCFKRTHLDLLIWMTLFVTTLPFGYLSLLDDVFLVDVRLVCLPFQLSYSNIILLLLCIRASSTDHLLEERPSVDSLLISADGHHSYSNNSYSYSLSCGESISSEWLCSLSSTETTPNSMDHKVQLQSSHDSKDYPPPPPSDCLSSTENTSHDLIQNMNTARCDSPPLSHQKKWLVKDSNNLYRIRYAPDKTQFQEKHLLTKDIELFINAFYSSVLF